MSNQQFRFIAGQWRKHVEARGIFNMPPETDMYVAAMLLFYAGFSAALNAYEEVADLPESEAAQLIYALHTEVEEIEAMAKVIMGDVQVS